MLYGLDIMTLCVVSVCRLGAKDDYTKDQGILVAHFSGYSHYLVLARSFLYRRAENQVIFSKLI